MTVRRKHSCERICDSEEEAHLSYGQASLTLASELTSKD